MSDAKMDFGLGNCTTAKRIALVIPSLALGGAERNILKLGEMLRRRGYYAEVWLTDRKPIQLATTMAVFTVESRAADSQSVRVLARVIGLARMIALRRPDHIISFLESSSIPALIAGTGLGVPVTVSVRGNPQRFIWFYRLIAYIGYGAAHFVISPSMEVARFFREHYLLDNAAGIPNVCDSPRGLLPDDAPPTPLKVVAVGRLVRGKRFDDVIKVAEKLSPDCQLTIVGEGPEMSSLRHLAENSWIRVKFVGELPPERIHSTIRDAHVLVTMSISECWPNVIAEAFSSGRPVIARDCDFGPREMIRNGVNGFLITGADDPRLEGIGAALRQPANWEALSTHALRSVSGWQEKDIGDSWLAILKPACVL